MDREVAIKKKKEFSCVVSKALDTMKYGYDDIKTRVKIYKTFETVFNQDDEDDGSIRVIAGSKAEGVSSIENSDSDFDLMLVQERFICCDDKLQLELDPDKVVLKMVRGDTAPGYTRLICKSSGKEALITLSNICFVHKFEGQKFVGHLLDTDDLSEHSDGEDETYSGPALTSVFPIEGINESESSTTPVKAVSIDKVMAFPCICTEPLQKRKDRKRFYDWPPEELIDEISKMNGHVVPVGSKGSENAHLEWRICYTEAEIKLIHSMNEIQLKLYVLLKMVAKKILKPICADISSYVMKNVLFWYVERSPSYRFKYEHLNGILYLALRYLQHCIHRKELSNYMIPERNPFAGRFDDHIKKQLVEKLHQLIYVQGTSFFLHYEDFKPLSSAVEEIQHSNEHELSHQNNAKTLSKYTQDFLQKTFEEGNERQQQFLTILLSEFTEEQIGNNILDIVFVSTSLRLLTAYIWKNSCYSL